MLSTIAALLVSLAQAASPAPAVPATCLSDAEAWPSCLGQPQGTPQFALDDPAADLYRQLDVLGETTRERNRRLKGLAERRDATAIIALTQLGWHAGLEGKSRRLHRYYQQALERATDDPQLDRYRHLSYAHACSRLGELDCALTHWHRAALTAPTGASWLPETWALALWQAGLHDAAIAWYQVAVRNDGLLGRVRSVETRTQEDHAVSRLRRDLYTAWVHRYATEQATVLVEVDIDAQGRVIRNQLVDGYNLHPELVAAIQSSVARWQFEPLPEQGASGVLGTVITVDIRRHVADDSADNPSTDFDIQYIEMADRYRDKAGAGGLRFPRDAALSRSEGIVFLRVLPDAHGNVARVEIDQSSGHPELDQAASQGVMSWRFVVRRIDGKALEEWRTVPIEFRILGSSAWFPPAPDYRRKLTQRFPY